MAQESCEVVKEMGLAICCLGMLYWTYQKAKFVCEREKSFVLFDCVFVNTPSAFGLSLLALGLCRSVLDVQYHQGSLEKMNEQF